MPTGYWANYGTNNQVSKASNSPAGYQYDAAGNLLSDGENEYAYDGEGRLCAVYNPATTSVTEYIYDAWNYRVIKADAVSGQSLPLTSTACNFVANATAGDISAGSYYVVGLDGTALDELDQNGNLLHSNVLANGQLLATYTPSLSNWTYSFNDWLGTKRVVAKSDGTVLETCLSLPFGDGQTCMGGADPSEQHFTDKERDQESGNDYFGARYYGSSMGRFMSPDPLGGHLENPQSLNKYAYALNNPLTNTDPTGRDSYLQCTPTEDNASTCQSQTIGYDKNGNPETTPVQGVTKDGKFTATQIGNDANGNLVDKTTGTGSYTASVNGSGVQFSNNGGQTSSTGVFVNGTPQTTFQDAGFANGGALSGFNFTLTNSKMESNQTEAGFFSFGGTPAQTGAALEAAGFSHRYGIEGGIEYRSSGSGWTGANSGHFILNPNVLIDPGVSLPVAGGNMHFGEHSMGFNPISDILHCVSDRAGVCQ